MVHFVVIVILWEAVKDHKCTWEIILCSELCTWNFNVIRNMKSRINSQMRDSIMGPPLEHDRPWILPWIKSINEFDVTFYMLLSLWCHQQDINRPGETQVQFVKIIVFIIIYRFVMLCEKYDDGLRAQDGFIQHKITLENITWVVHCRTTLACWTNTDLT